MAPGRKAQKKREAPAVTLPALIAKTKKKRVPSPVDKEDDEEVATPSPVKSHTTRRAAAVAELEESPAHSVSSQQSASTGASKHARDVVLNPEATMATMPTDELVKRLKVACEHFQSLGQVDTQENHEELIPFCLHIAGEEFLNHQDRDVKILVAGCVADTLRIYAPNAPYKETGQISTVLKFLASQLKGLKDVKSVTYKRYHYLLENIAFVKTFAMTFDMDEEEGQEILIELFEIVFATLRDDHTDKLKLMLMELLVPLILEGQAISYELLDVVMKNILEPESTTSKAARQLARDLIFRCADSLEPITNSLLTAILIGSTSDCENLFVTPCVFDLIHELYSISPSLVHTSLPQLEYKLKSLNETERLGAVNLCARLFPQDNCNIAQSYTNLWVAFLGRFNDVSLEIRNTCVNSSTQLLLTDHSEIKKDVVKALSGRVHDTDESVRLNVVKCVISAATKAFDYVTGCSQLMDCVKERTLDKKAAIRKESLQGLGTIYKMCLDRNKDPPVWIHQKILQGYYLQDVEDRVLIEKLMNTCLVPYELPPQERMVQLAWVCTTAEPSQLRAFIEIQKNLTSTRRSLQELVNCLRKPNANHEYQTMALNYRMATLAKICPWAARGSSSSTDFISNFVKDLKSHPLLLDSLQLMGDPNSDCKTVLDSVNKVIKKLCPPSAASNSYGSHLQVMLQRASSVLIDSESILMLLQFVKALVVGDVSQEDPLLGKAFPRLEIVIERTCYLISCLAFLFTPHFDHAECLQVLEEILCLDELDKMSSSHLLAALVSVGKQSRPVGEHQPDLMEQLVNHCQTLIESGSHRQAKMAIRCLYANLHDEATRNKVFANILDSIVAPNLQCPQSSNAFSTAVVALGHIAMCMSSEFNNKLKVLVSRHVVKGLLVAPERTGDDTSKNSDKQWVDYDKLPLITQSMVLGIKALARWLLGLRTDVVENALKTFKVLTAFVETGGAFTENRDKEQGKIFPLTDSEKAHLRLAAGCAMLKIIQQKGVGDHYTTVQFYNLAQLMNDAVLQVRVKFATKLHKGLCRGIPDKCLPIDFMGFYTLGAWEPDRKHKQSLKQFLQTDIKIRRDYIKMVMTNHPDKVKAQEHMIHMMPEMMVAFAVAILANNPGFTDVDDVDNLKDVEKALWMIMEPLVTKNESYSFAWYKQLFQGIKNRTNAVDPLDDEINVRMYTVCDVALELLIKHNKYKGEGNTVVVRAKVPTAYFREHDDPNFENTKVYLSQDYLKGTQKKTLSMAGRTPRVTQNKKPAGTPKQKATKDGVAGTPKGRPAKRGRKKKVEEEEVDEDIDASPADAKRTRLEMVGEVGSDELRNQGENPINGSDQRSVVNGESEGEEDHIHTDAEDSDEGEEPPGEKEKGAAAEEDEDGGNGEPDSPPEVTEKKTRGRGKATVATEEDEENDEPNPPPEVTEKKTRGKGKAAIAAKASNQEGKGAKQTKTSAAATRKQAAAAGSATKVRKMAAVRFSARNKK